MVVLRCGRNEYFDTPTKSCTDCGVYCDNMDIQGTREQCERLCSDSDYFTTTTATVTTAASSTTTITSGGVAVICIVILVVLLVVTSLLVYYKKNLVKVIKTHECCVEEHQHVIAQETGEDTQTPGPRSLLENAFADLPQREYDLSTDLTYR